MMISSQIIINRREDSDSEYDDFLSPDMRGPPQERLSDNNRQHRDIVIQDQRESTDQIDSSSVRPSNQIQIQTQISPRQQRQNDQRIAVVGQSQRLPIHELNDDFEIHKSVQIEDVDTPEQKVIKSLMHFEKLVNLIGFKHANIKIECSNTIL